MIVGLIILWSWRRRSSTRRPSGRSTSSLWSNQLQLCDSTTTSTTRRNADIYALWNQTSLISCLSGHTSSHSGSSKWSYEYRQQHTHRGLCMRYLYLEKRQVSFIYSTLSSETYSHNMEKTIQIRIREDSDFITTSAKIDDAIIKVWYPAIVSVRRDVGTISEKQRGYYFWVVVEICREYHGYSKDEMHGHLKRWYLPDTQSLLDELSPLYNDLDGARRVIDRFLQIHEDLTITNETTGSFEEYLKNIRESYAKQNIFIPLPNEDQQWDGWQRMQ